MDAIIPLLGAGIFLAAILTSRNRLPSMVARNARAGRVDRPDRRKLQSDPVPLGAGAACLAGAGLPVAGGLTLILLHRFFGLSLPDAIAVHAEGLFYRAPQVAALLAGAVALGWMGRMDDSRGLSILARLVIQTLVALALALSGVQATLFIEQPLLQIVLTVVWILFVTNAFNFIDNSDGALITCATVSSSGVLLIAGLDGQFFVAALALALLGGLLGVLPSNWSPAKAYMGDEGSMGVGFLLAGLTLVLTTHHSPDSVNLKPFLIPPLLVLVPAVDAAWVMVRRISEKRSPAEAGRDHLAHSLQRRGWPPSRVCFLLGGFGAVGIAAAIILHGRSVGHFATMTLALLASVVFYCSQRRERTRP